MSHYAVAVFHRKDQTVDELLAPYSENLKVDPYVSMSRQEAIEYARKHIKGYEGKTDEEDARLEKELLADEKELAEHNMLVDLGRNDLGKISKFGTVSVEKLHSIERFSHVMHIGSTVRGEIRDDKDALDAIEAVLPAGTLSGAPKIRACQLIGEFENNKRGIYGGAIGYIDFTGNMDTCIAIRIAYKKNDKVFVRSGAGIVADSDPEKEFEECMNKAKASLTALMLSEGVED